MKKEIKELIEQNYNFKIKEIEEAPRQFIAETFFIKTTDNRDYFVKVTDKKFYIPDTIKSLPLIDAIHKSGIDKMSYPIKTKNGSLYIYENNTLIVIYNRIFANQSYDYDFFAYGKLLAEIHQESLNIKGNYPKEDFTFFNQENFLKQFEQVLDLGLFKIYEERIKGEFEDFKKTAERCKNKNISLVATHGDSGGNVLVATKDDIYIIDWDETYFAASERDIWISKDFAGFMDGYKSIRQDFEPDEDLLKFYTYRYYFNNMTQYYFEEILGAHSKERKQKAITSFENEFIMDWILPYLEKIK